MKPVVEDNYLEPDDFNTIHKIFMGEKFPWNYYEYIDDKNEKNRGQFVHIVYFYTLDDHSTLELLKEKLFKKMEVNIVHRIKANLTIQTPEIIQNKFHIDLNGEDGPNWRTSIYYMNTNNGYTIFEDGTKVESVANRLLTFHGNTKHAASSCSDQHRRVVFNINYYT